MKMICKPEEVCVLTINQRTGTVFLDGVGYYYMDGDEQVRCDSLGSARMMLYRYLNLQCSPEPSKQKRVIDWGAIMLGIGVLFLLYISAFTFLHLIKAPSGVPSSKAGTIPQQGEDK